MRLEYFEMIDRIASLDRAAGRITALAEVPRGMRGYQVLVTVGIGHAQPDG